MRSVLLGLLLLGCVTIQSSEAQFQTVTAYGQQQIEPTPLHYGIWLMTVECSGQVRDFPGVTWFIADSLRGPENEIIWGIWTTERKIVLAKGLALLPGLVAHELMHDLYAGAIPPEVERRCTLRLDPNDLRTILNG